MRENKCKAKKEKDNLIAKLMRIWIKINMVNKMSRVTSKSSFKMFLMKLTNKIHIQQRIRKTHIKSLNTKLNTYPKKGKKVGLKEIKVALKKEIKILKVRAVKMVNSKKEDEIIYIFMYLLSDSLRIS